MLSHFSTRELKANLRHTRAAATNIQRIMALFVEHYEYEKAHYDKMGPLLVKYMYTLEQELKDRGEKPARWAKPDWLEKYPVERILPSEMVELQGLISGLSTVSDIQRFLWKKTKET